MRFIITGATGFIGTTTALALLDAGHLVHGIDEMSDYYDPALKRMNLSALHEHSNFSFSPRDLTSGCEDLFEGAEVVIHLAAQPGVRKSWLDFTSYARANVEATKHVLDLSLRFGVQRVVYASSSSVYGNATRYPTPESTQPSPSSPYAVTKLAGEQLCGVFALEHGLSTVSLRYFTVYGPRQRPDMLTHRLIDAAHTGEPVTIFGDGNQIRDFTFVGDVARANVAAAHADVSAGSVYNIAGGSAVSVNDMIEAVEHATGRRVPRVTAPQSAGDVEQTGADVGRAYTELGWSPDVDLADGLASQVVAYRSAHRLAVV